MKAGRAVRIISLTVAVLIAFLSVIIMEGQTADMRAEEKAKTARINALAEPYMTEYERSVGEMAKLKTEYEKVDGIGRRMTMIIFQHCTDNLYSVEYRRALNQREMQAIFTVKDSEMIGDEGCITLEQYRLLAEKGWLVALTLPDKDRDLCEYFDEMKEKFAALGIDFPKIFVYPRDSRYTPELHGQVLAAGFDTVAFNLEDGGCPFTDQPLTASTDVLYVPYLYTSKKTHIRDRFEDLIGAGQNCSISTGCAKQGMSGEAAYVDTTLNNLVDIVETVYTELGSYRSLKNYRAERLRAGTDCAKRLSEITVTVEGLQAIRSWTFDKMMGIYKTYGDASGGSENLPEEQVPVRKELYGISERNG